ncbi:helix-turn-helix transcriptional regulator [Brevibacillus sp. DP1.3A]|uniref:helix-turn-helix domain-containing protein n=1 Tax=Brevibacillus sp. DP1.3A TaxID=2738867 RepID=UPI00156AC49A|nr:helix-turn-helix transcriptional regulator [Brevibacillus sp. DP1.3A]UED76933.1 helix-turn-helix domain-containing protein [Brevibacillus sp. DP1.3A]
MFGLRKKRSKLGKRLDKRGFTQQWLSKESGVNNTTVSRLASDNEYLATMKTAQRILNALRRVDKNAKQDDFWTM